MYAKTNFAFTLILKLSFLILLGQSQQCPDIYLRFSKEHTYCQPRNINCDIFETKVTPEDIDVILRVHNKLRNKIAAGQVNGFPEASNILQMVWDQELADVAQKRTEQCNFSHDCNECRRVANFPVGQNIAYMMSMGCGSGGCSKPTKRDWEKVINNFYDEVKFFSPIQLSSFQPATGPDTYGHFTQVVWADTWRVGCGFVTYNIPNGYKQLYMCNYGPAGNTISEPLYKPGRICSGCPKNSCCGQSCPGTEFPGLCKILNENEAPIYDSPENSLFHCDFRTDCKFSKVGGSDWDIKKTLSGPYIAVVVPPGGSSSLIFDDYIKPATSFCLKVQYSAGPVASGQISDYTIDLIAEAPGASIPKMVLNPSPANSYYTYKLSLNWNFATKVGFKFSVPNGASTQYLDIKDVTATEGPC